MSIIQGTPSEHGFYMPGEFEPHHGCMMIWPYRTGSWPFEAKGAREAFAKVAKAVAESEKVYLLVEEHLLLQAKSYLGDLVTYINIPTDDAWARDTGPTFVKNDQGEIRGINWKFNAWGGDYDGLYVHYEKDNLVAPKFLEAMEKDCYDAGNFVLEGGAIHTDGEGTLLVTEACLLSKGRNPSLTKEQIEDTLRVYLGVKKIIWLPHGIYQDETNEHIDNICAFCAPGEVVLAWSEDENDPQYAYSMADFEVLLKETDAKGRKIKVHKIPIPKKAVCVKAEDLPGYVYEEGEDTREAGERLAASYVNFYIANNSIVMPVFGDENDAVAMDILGNCFPDRKIVPIPARDILLGGGNIHCITQQIPK